MKQANFLLKKIAKRNKDEDIQISKQLIGSQKLEQRRKI